MSDLCNIPHPLKREGTYQFERFPLPLGNDYVQLDERNLSDLIQQSAEFARFVNYYNQQNFPDGDWTAFFEEIYDYNTKTLLFDDISDIEGLGNTSPHIALFLAFLELFSISQANLNTLTQKHLDFYYRTMLQLTSLAENPDSVAAVFALSNNYDSVLVPKGTPLNAGKDNTGKDVYFLTDDDLIVNNAEIVEVKTVFVKKDGNGSPLDVFISEDALTENIVDPTSPLGAWYTFGSQNNPVKAAIGFAIASPMFNLSEGRRRITFQFANFQNVDRSVLIANYTTTSGWASATLDTLMSPPGTATDPYNPGSVNCLMLQLSPLDPPMVPYNPAIHNNGAPPNMLFSTVHPVIQITINTTNEQKFSSTYALLKKVAASNIKITVNVNGVRNLIVQNDVGLLDPTKPFYPFGIQPSKGKSQLYIGCYEAFNKYLFSFHLSINWNGLPGNMQKYYSGYGLLAPQMIEGDPVTIPVAPFPAQIMGNLTIPLVASLPNYITLTDATSGGTWSSTNAYVATVGSTGIVTGVSAGTTTITYTVNSVSTTAVVTVYTYANEVVVPQIMGNLTVYENNVTPLLLTASISGGTWSVITGGTGNGTISSSGSFTGTAVGTVFIKYAIGAPDGNATAVITVLPPGTTTTVPGRVNLSQLRQNNNANNFMNQWKVPFQQGHPPGDLFILNTGIWDLLKLNFGAKYLNRGRKHKQNTTNSYKNYIPVTSPYVYGAPRLYSPKTSWGFVKILLGYDFGQTIYPKLVQTIALDTVVNVMNSQVSQISQISDGKSPPAPAVPPVVPNQPYIPSFKSIHLDYVCVGTLDFKIPGEHQFFHITPYGSDEKLTSKYKLVPDLIYEGTLYLGIGGITYAESVNIYFQFLNGSGNPDEPITSANQAVWSYLSGNTWILLDENADIVKDTTSGFTSAGIIVFKIPQDAISSHTILTDGLVWLKVSVSTQSDAYPYMLGISSQVIQATYSDQGNDPLRLQVPLPADSITKMQTKILGISGVTQPYSSYDGFIAEQTSDFYTRVSERLRHKARSWSIWDYERIALQQFPAIYKIKCISHSVPSSEYAPGNVLIVCLPNPENVNTIDILQPKVSSTTLSAVGTYLAQFASPFATINVINPTYEALKVVCDVQIAAGYDEYYYGEQLKKDLTQFIAPWSVTDTANNHEQISFEGKIFISQITNFIEEQPYIDFITTISVYKKLSKLIKCDDMIQAGNEHSILTSVPFDQHEVKTDAVC